MAHINQYKRTLRPRSRNDQRHVKFTYEGNISDKQTWAKIKA